MLTIQCTKKCSEELPHQLVELDPKRDSLYSWHAHIFLLNRKKCVMVMNNVTRYNFIMFGLKKEHFKSFDEIILKEIEENLRADKIDDQLINNYLSKCDSITYTKTSDRSIISQMNDLIYIFKYRVDQEKLKGTTTEIFEMNRFFNRFIMTRLPELYSGKTMRNELEKREN